MKHGKLIAIAAATAVSAGLAAHAAQAKEIRLKAASFLPTRTVYAKYFGEFVKETNKQCRGMLRISVVGPAAIKSLEQWKALREGVIDMHYGPPNYYKGVLPEADVMNLAKNDPAEQRKNGAWALLNEAHRAKMNAVYLTHLLSGINFYVYTREKPANNGRFEGMRLRSVPIYDSFFRSLGASPVRMAPPAVYTALERGTVDGYGWPLWGVNDLGWHKYTKYRHGPGFFSSLVNILINKDKFDSMPKTHQDCLMKTTVWLEGQWPKWRDAENKKQIAAQDKAGIKYVDLGQGFREAAEKDYWTLMMKANADFVSKMRPLITK